MRSFKCVKYVCGFEQFTTPDIWFRTIKCIHSKKKKYAQESTCTYFNWKNFSSSVQDELQPITRAVLPGKVRMQDNITAIAWKPVFKVFLRIWRKLLQHFSDDEKYCQIQGSLQKQWDSLVQMLHLWGSRHASLLKNISWISVLKSVFICLTWVKIWRGFAQTAWLCQTSSCFTASSYRLSIHCKKINWPYLI